MSGFEYVTRAGWGAKPPTGKLSFYPHVPTVGVIHYIGSGVLGQDDEFARMRQLQATAQAGVHGDKYVDFPYNEAIGQSGRQFEGRGVSFVNGANSGAANASMYSILALIGDGDVPSDALKASIVDLAEKRGLKQLVPHSLVATQGTACPGPRLTLWLAGTPLSSRPPSAGDAVLPPLDLVPILKMKQAIAIGAMV